MVLPPGGVRAGPTEPQIQLVSGDKDAPVTRLFTRILTAFWLALKPQPQTTATNTPVRPPSNFDNGGPSNISHNSNAPAQSRETAAQRE